MGSEETVSRREVLSVLIKGSAVVSVSGMTGMMTACGGGGGGGSDGSGSSSSSSSGSSSSTSSTSSSGSGSSTSSSSSSSSSSGGTSSSSSSGSGSSGSSSASSSSGGGGLAVTANFTQIHAQPLLKSRLGFAQNLHTLGAGLEGTATYLGELGACGFSGACEFDGWFKWGAANRNPCMVATYDGNGRAVTMQPYPSTTVTAWASALNGRGVRCGIQLVGATPETQPVSAPYGAAHPAPGDISAHCAKLVAWTRGNLWPVPVDWYLWNEPGHTLNGVEQGFHDDGSRFVESDADYATRRSQRRQEARDVLWQLYQGTFVKTSPVIGQWASASCGPLLAGDTQTGNGRALPDGTTFRYAWWSKYSSSFNSSTTLGNAYAVANDFGNRGSAIFGSTGDFQGQDWPIVITQGGPSLLKTGDGDGGDSGDNPGADTRMGPACEMLTMLAADCATPELALRHWSYWLGGQDGFLSDDGMGGYTQRHRYTAMKMWTRVPTRRVALSGVQQTPVADGKQYGMQGVLGVAGIDPGGQTAAILLWNESDTPLGVTVSTASLPSALQAVQPVVTMLNEAHPVGVGQAWQDGSLQLGARSAWLVTWSVTASPEARRQPYADGSRTPVFLRRVDSYKRPKGASAYFDQIRGVAWVMPTTSYSGALGTGAAWSGLPDSLWLTLWAWTVDVPALPVTVTCDYGSGAVSLLSTTAGAITSGQVVELPLVARAPAGWAGGNRTGDIRISVSGASAMRLEVWVSGTLALAQAVRPDFDTFEAHFSPSPSNSAGFRALNCQTPRYMDC